MSKYKVGQKVKVIMSKYKVGQKVRVKTDIEVGSISSNNTDFAEEMAKFRGQVVTIARIHTSDEKDYDIEEDRHEFTWAEDWFEPVEEVKCKADLKDFDIITLANGDRLSYFDGEFSDLTDGYSNDICDLDDLNDDLTFARSYREEENKVVKVERPATYYEVFNRDEEIREMTVEEISKALGYEVKIVKEK